MIVSPQAMIVYNFSIIPSRPEGLPPGEAEAARTAGGRDGTVGMPEAAER